ncbi:MAG: arginine--tRNA ligase [Legionellaceae bacterium]|nr:arginine--tRNA ligase [Legionellaceae bacterium]
MRDHLIQLIEASLKALQSEGELAEALTYRVQIDRARDNKHGDYACNIAMMLAKQAKKSPRELAEHILKHLPESEHVDRVDIAGPGFINFFVHHAVKQTVVSTIFEEAERFGHSNLGQGKKLHIEFVSANPTGPLHVGHGRSAAYGAALSDLLAANGYQVHREYYVNDAGRQMDILATSMWLRYLGLHGLTFDFPKNGYVGEYVIDIAEAFKTAHANKFVKSIAEVFHEVPPDEKDGGDKETHVDALIANAKKLLGDDYHLAHQLVLKTVLDDIKNDLAEFGVNYQEWFSENSLYQTNAVQHALDVLKKNNYVYEKEGALWFKSSEFGDEKDRVLVRKNGNLTYFTPDIAYHLNKLERGFDEVIDVLGADHHGYVPRIRAAMRALSKGSDVLTVPIVQFASLYRHGEKVKMTTRGGSFVTLRQLREEVGNDAARFFYVMRKVDQHMDFDLDLATSKSNENPVYYIQYAHARICSVFRQLKDKSYTFDQAVGLNHLGALTVKHESELLDCLARFPEIMLRAAKNLDPTTLANYLRELANEFHAYYNAEQFILDDEGLRNARLCLIKATQQVLQNGLTILGVSAPEKM